MFIVFFQFQIVYTVVPQRTSLRADQDIDCLNVLTYIKLSVVRVIFLQSRKIAIVAQVCRNFKCTIVIR